MGKVLIILDPAHCNQCLLEFGIYIGQTTKSVLAVVLTDNDAGNSKLIERDLHGFPIGFLDAESAKNKLIQKAELEQTIMDFEKKCEAEGIQCFVHRDHGMAVHELIFESRFADMLLIYEGMGRKKRSEQNSTALLRTVLKKAECPVIIVPRHQKIQEIRDVLFCYNGSSEAMHAIRNFSYLFSSIKDKTLIILKDHEATKECGQANARLTEWTATHFTQIRREVMDRKDQKLSDLLTDEKNVFVVMGYSNWKSWVNQLKKEMAEVQKKNTVLTVFVAH